MRIIRSVLMLVVIFHSSMAFGEVWKHYIPGNNITDITVYGDSVWCLTPCSIVRWSKHDGTYVQYTKRDGIPVDNMYNIKKVLIDQSGIPWLAYQNNSGPAAICRFDGKSPVVYNVNDNDIPKSSFISSFKDSKGNLWFGSDGDGVGRFDGTVWKTFRPQDTLSHVNAVVQDSRGMVWFAANGLWGYDGKKLARYTIPGKLEKTSVRCIASDTCGAVWFGTASGISRFDGNFWKNYTTSDGLVSNDVNVIVSDRKGGIWVGTNGGVSHFDGSTWNSFQEDEYLISNKVTGIAIDADGNAWFSHGAADMGITIYDGKRMAWRTTSNSTVPTNDVRIVASGPDGIVWCVIDTGVMSWDGKEWKKYGVADGLKSVKVNSITIDALNRKWFLYSSSLKAGATCFDGDSWKTYTTADGLPSDAILAVSAQKDGVLWFSGSEGVSRFDGVSWDSYPKNDRLFSATINSIAQDGTGILWFATDSGLTRFDGDSWWTYTTSDGLPKDKVDMVQCAPDGSPWLLCDGTLLRFDGTAFQLYPLPVDAGLSDVFRYSVSSITWDKNGVLWTDTFRRLPDENEGYVFGGLWCLRNGQWEENHSFSLYGSRYNISHIIFDDSGGMWFSNGINLERFDGNSFREYAINGPFVYWNGICDEGNRVWFFGSGCAGYLDGNTWRNTGIQSEFSGVENISLDADNTMWYNNPNGIFKFDGENSTHIISYKNFPVTDYIRSFARDGNGIFWVVFSKSDTLYRFDGNAWTTVPEITGLFSKAISQVKVDTNGVLWVITDTNICWYDGKHWNNKEIPNAVIIHFDKFKNVWFITPDGITTYNGNEWKVMVEKENVPAYYSILGMDNENHIWLNIQGGGVARYDGMSWKTYTVADGLLSLWGVDYLIVDGNNVKWFLTTEGICSLDERSGAGSDVVPQPITLRGNYPNPFNAGTGIEFDLYSWGRVDLSIYNIMGQKVRTIMPGKLDAGRHTISWNGMDDRGKRVSSGPYFYHIKNEGRVEHGRMMLLK